MLFYTSSIPITIRVNSQVKHIEATPDQNNLNPEHVYSLGRSEWEYLEKYISEKNLKIEDVISLRDDTAFSTWKHLPVFLGRKDENFTSLIDQLEQVKINNPGKTKFRIAINNGFGSSLGDSLIGITAFRHVYPILAKYLPGLRIDIIMGWIHDESVMQLYEQVPEFNVIIEENCSLAHFSKYQAVIDFYGLLILPNYGKIPIVDWYMLWMGIDIDNISKHDKRNSIYIPVDDGIKIESFLGDFSGKTILLNEKASVNLRCIQPEYMKKLTRYLLDEYPDFRFVSLQKPDFEHPRLLDFSNKTPTLNLLSALVYSVDAIITPDTYTLHLADATNTPCVALYTSVSPRRYPYYPLTEGILLPCATELPAWNKSKVSDEEWSKISHEYDTAWNNLDLEKIKIALNDVLSRSSLYMQMPRQYNIRNNNLYKLENNIWNGIGLTHVDITENITKSIHIIAKQYLTYADNVVCMCIDDQASMIELSRMIGHLGKLIVYEPRRQISQLLSANAVANQLDNISCYTMLPYDSSGDLLNIRFLDVRSEYNTISSNNCVVSDSVITTKLDDWKLKQCRMLIINKPINIVKSLIGSTETIKRLSPILLIVCETKEIYGINTFLESIDYAYTIFPIDSFGEYSLIMSVVKSK